MAGSIHRYKKDKDFTIVDKVPLEDVNLSWKAKGLLTYLISLPETWQINIADLEKRSTDGRESTASGLQELIKKMYVFRERKMDKIGRFEGYDYHVFERIEHTIAWITENGKAVNGKSENGKPATNKKTKRRWDAMIPAFCNDYFSLALR